MSKVLVLYTSPIEKNKSISSNITDEFINEYKKYNFQDEIKILDLNQVEKFSRSMTSNNIGEFFSDPINDEYIDILKNIDKLIISISMINFSIPSVLKNFLDRIAIANKTFSYKYSKKGEAIGLLNNLKVQIIATQGAPMDWYPWSSHFKYLEGIWNFLGAKVEPTLVVAGVKVGDNLKKKPQEFTKMYINDIKEKASKF